MTANQRDSDDRTARTPNERDESNRLPVSLRRRDVLKTAAAATVVAGGFSGSGAASHESDGPGPAIEQSVIDNFERSDPLDAYGGATNHYSVTSTHYDGNQALTNDSGEFASVVSTAGLDHYPERGDEFTVLLNNAGDDNFAAVHFFAQEETDQPDGYAVGISGQSAFKLWRIEAGSATTIASRDLPADEQVDGWYRLKVRSDGTTVYADLYEDEDLFGTGGEYDYYRLASVRADDTTFSAGGIGFRSAGNGEVWDYPTVEGCASPTASVIESFDRLRPLVKYGGGTDLFQYGPDHNALSALENDGDEFGSVASTSGLCDYPERGDAFSFEAQKLSSDEFFAMHFFAQSETDQPDSYAVGVSGQGAFKLWRIEDGSATTIASRTLPPDEQQSRYVVRVWSDSREIYANLYDEPLLFLRASIRAEDETYSSGGIGFRGAGTGATFADVHFEDVPPGERAPAPVEDFERSDPLDVYGGRTDLYGAEDSTVYSDFRALTNDGGEFGSVVSTAGLDDYPERGEEFEFHFNNAGDDNFVATHFFAQEETDQPDSYAAGISGQGAWELWRIEDGEATTIASQDLSSDEQVEGWYRAEVRSDDSAIQADLYDTTALGSDPMASIRAADSTYSSGGIGFRSAGNGEVWDLVGR